MSEQNFIEDNILIISKQTMDLFLKQKNPADVIALYCFYYYTAKWQKTNQIKCTTGYAAKGLNKSEDVIRRTKKVLNEIGLIEDLKTKGNNNKITGWYIKINYVWKKETVKKIHPTDFPEGGENEKTLKSHPQVFPQGGVSHSVEKPNTNALSANNLNALSANSLNCEASFTVTDESISPNKKIGNTELPELKIVSPDEIKHKQLIDLFDKAYFEMYGEKMTGWNRESKSVKSILENRSREPNVIYKKMKILQSLINNPPDNFWAGMVFLPSTIDKHWDRLVERKPVLSKQQLKDKSTIEFAEKWMNKNAK